MTVKKISLSVALILFGVVLLRYAYAGGDGALSQEATVPTTQSTVGMDDGSKGESDGLLAPKLDISDPADRQRLLDNFDRESGILKNMGLSEDELKTLKEAVINGDQKQIEKIYHRGRAMAEENNE